MFAGLEVSFWLISIALVLLALVLVTIWFRQLPGNSQSFLSDSPPGNFSNSNSSEAIVTVQPGGRVDFVNDLAREWFGLRQDELAELEKLIRMVRPAEDFLSLCANQGQKRLSVGGRLVEVTSYQVPGPYPLMFLALRGVDLSVGTGDAAVDSSMLKIISDFGRDVSESLDVDQTLYSILLNVSHLVPADAIEVKTWTDASQTLVPYVLDPAGASKIARVANSHFGSLTDQLVSRRSPLLLSDVRTAATPVVYSNGNSPIQSYLGFPLVAKDEFIGTLEIGHLAPGTLIQRDFDLLQLVASQAAFSIQNAFAFSREKNRSMELSGLVNLAQAVGTAQDFAQLIRRLIESIAPLFSVEILGFLLYDANKRTLEGQVPFQGLPGHIVEIYRTTIPERSPAEKILSERKLISTRSATSDDTWGILGLQTIAQAASLRESILAPMVTGEDFVGYVQFSNHRQGASDFSESELRLIENVASQAAGIIQNSFTVERARQRAMRSDGLRRIASLTSSFATIDEVIRFSVGEVSRLLRSDLAALYLLDEKNGELILHEGSVVGAYPESSGPLARLHLDGAPLRSTVAGSLQPVSTGRLRTEKNVSPSYLPLFSNLQMESVLILPVAVGEKTLGELVLASRNAEFFGNYDLEVALAAAEQIAVAVDGASRSVQTDESLRQRVEQLTSLARVSRELNSTSDLKTLL